MSSSEPSEGWHSGTPTKTIKEDFCQIIHNMEQEMNGIRANMREIYAISADNERKMKNLKGQILVFKQIVEETYPEISEEDTADYSEDTDQTKPKTLMSAPEDVITIQNDTPIALHENHTKRLSDKVLEKSPVKRLKTNAPESSTSAGNQGTLPESASSHTPKKLRASVTREQESTQPNANGAGRKSIANYVSPDGLDTQMDSMAELSENQIEDMPDSATITVDVNYNYPNQSATENEDNMVPQAASTSTEKISEEDNVSDEQLAIQRAANSSWGILPASELQSFLYLSKEDTDNSVQLAKMSFTEDIKLLYYQLIVLKHNLIKAKSEVRSGTLSAIREFDETLETVITFFENEVQMEGGNYFPENS